MRSFFKLLYRREDLSVTSTNVNWHISSTVILLGLNIFCYNDTYVVIIVHLSNTLQRLVVVVRTSIYNNTACILPIVLVVS